MKEGRRFTSVHCWMRPLLIRRLRTVATAPVLLCIDGERVGADFVCRVAVGGDAIGADNHRIDLPGRHERGGGAVCYEGRRQALLHQLVRRKPRTCHEVRGVTVVRIDMHEVRRACSQCTAILRILAVTHDCLL